MSSEVKEVCWDKTLGFLILRSWLGIRCLLTGLEKFAGYKVTEEPLMDEFGNPDVTGAMVEVKHKVYSFASYHGLPDSLAKTLKNEPLLPSFLFVPYVASLGYVLILLGLMLLFGICTRVALFVSGILWVSLTVGLILINQNDGVAWLGIHVALSALALGWAGHNRFALYNRW